MIPTEQAKQEMNDACFNFFPSQSKQKLVKESQNQFLNLLIRRICKLDSYNADSYFDSSRKLAASRINHPTLVPLGKETHITLKKDILFSYCEHFNLVPLWVVVSHRYSERTLCEYNLEPHRNDIIHPKFTYLIQFGKCKNPTRFRMSSWSNLCGKCPILEDR